MLVAAVTVALDAPTALQAGHDADRGRLRTAALSPPSVYSDSLNNCVDEASCTTAAIQTEADSVLVVLISTNSGSTAVSGVTDTSGATFRMEMYSAVADDLNDSIWEAIDIPSEASETVTATLTAGANWGLTVIDVTGAGDPWVSSADCGATGGPPFLGDFAVLGDTAEACETGDIPADSLILLEYNAGGGGKASVLNESQTLIGYSGSSGRVQTVASLAFTSASAPVQLSATYVSDISPSPSGGIVLSADPEGNCVPVTASAKSIAGWTATGTGAVASGARVSDADVPVGYPVTVYANDTPSGSTTRWYLNYSSGGTVADATSDWALNATQDPFTFTVNSTADLTLTYQAIVAGAGACSLDVWSFGALAPASLQFGLVGSASQVRGNVSALAEVNVSVTVDGCFALLNGGAGTPLPSYVYVRLEGVTYPILYGCGLVGYVTATLANGPYTVQGWAVDGTAGANGTGANTSSHWSFQVNAPSRGPPTELSTDPSLVVYEWVAAAVGVGVGLLVGILSLGRRRAKDLD